MNERIREIADEAFKGLGTNPVYATAMIYASKELEKFAELLIQECAEVADTADATREKWQSVGKFVKEHFGVRE